MLEGAFRAFSTGLFKLLGRDSDVLHVASEHEIHQVFIVLVYFFVFLLILIIFVRLKN